MTNKEIKLATEKAEREIAEILEQFTRETDITKDDYIGISSEYVGAVVEYTVNIFWDANEQ